MEDNALGFVNFSATLAVYLLLTALLLVCVSDNACDSYLRETIEWDCKC
jgi:hypothetical protein